MLDTPEARRASRNESINANRSSTDSSHASECEKSSVTLRMPPMASVVLVVVVVLVVIVVVVVGQLKRFARSSPEPLSSFASSSSLAVGSTKIPASTHSLSCHGTGGHTSTVPGPHCVNRRHILSEVGVGPRNSYSPETQSVMVEHTRSEMADSPKYVGGLDSNCVDSSHTVSNEQIRSFVAPGATDWNSVRGRHGVTAVQTRSDIGVRATDSYCSSGVHTVAARHVRSVVVVGDIVSYSVGSHAEMRRHRKSEVGVAGATM